MAETPADDPQFPADDDLFSTPGPRRARAIEHEAKARRSRGRLLFGLGFLVVGAVVIGLAIWSFSSDEGSDQRSVGTLTGQDLDATDVASESVVSTTAAGTGTGAGAPAAKAQWPSVTGVRPPEFGKPYDPPPAARGSLEDGFYLWQDFDGWHLWVVGGSADDRVTITGDAEITKADATGGEVAIDKRPTSLTFSRGDATEEVVGIDFNPGYYAKTLIFTTEGELPLHVGHDRKVMSDSYGISYSTASR